MTINNNSIYFKAILESPLIFKIKTTAISLFAQWTEQVRQQYPSCFLERDTQTLADDLITALAKSLELVWRQENQKKHHTSGYIIVLFIDFASSTLNTHWCQEYIYKQADDYKEHLFLKTLTQFLKLDQIAAKKIESLYAHQLTKETNIPQQQPDKNYKVIDFNEFKVKRNTNINFKTNMLQYLESILYEKHYSVFGNILKHKFSLPLSDFFHSDEIQTLIESVILPGKP